MSKIDVINISGDVVGEAELAEGIFDIEVSDHAVYQAVKNYLANQRQGTQSTKTRAEVRGGGRKPWRQKGTGRARAGSIRSPLWVGGGVTFAPKPRDYGYKLPKKTKRLALKSALTDKAKNEAIKVVDELGLEEISTKEAAKVLVSLAGDSKTLIVTGQKDEIVYKSFRNIPTAQVQVANYLNVYDIVNADLMILTKDALEVVEEVFS